jgi:hypothetical protein
MRELIVLTEYPAKALIRNLLRGKEFKERRCSSLCVLSSSVALAQDDRRLGTIFLTRLTMLL